MSKIAQNDLLQKMLQMQKEFQVLEYLDPPISELASAIMTEGGELWAIAGGKWWKHYLEGQEPRFRQYEELQGPYLEDVEEQNKEEIVEESIDILHFLLAVWLRLDLTAEDVYKIYSQKMGINIQRQKDGY